MKKTAHIQVEKAADNLRLQQQVKFTESVWSGKTGNRSLLG